MGATPDYLLVLKGRCGRDTAAGLPSGPTTAAQSPMRKAPPEAGVREQAETFRKRNGGHDFTGSNGQIDDARYPASLRRSGLEVVEGLPRE
jgi:hypothetical protein